MGGTLDLTRAGAKLKVSTKVNMRYTIIAHRAEGGGVDEFMGIVMLRQEQEEIEKDLASVFKRAGMTGKTDLKRYWKKQSQDEDIYVPNLRELLSEIRAHFNPTPLGSDDWLVKDRNQDQKDRVYHFRK
jgi:hypothetical protein